MIRLYITSIIEMSIYVRYFFLVSLLIIGKINFLIIINENNSLIK